MKKMFRCLMGGILMLMPFTAVPQGTFQNLDFESANVPPSIGYEPYGTFVPIASALPGWTAFWGTQQLSQVGYNSPTAGAITVSLIGPNWNSADVLQYGVGIIDGNYSVDVQGGLPPPNSTVPEPASLAQNGTVPSTAESLQFKAFGGPFIVTFAGNALDLVSLSSGVSEDGLPYTLYGANISAWAGQTGELEFTSAGNGFAGFVLDDITFSPNSVTPEPNALALMLTGGAALAARRWRTLHRTFQR